MTTLRPPPSVIPRRRHRRRFGEWLIPDEALCIDRPPLADYTVDLHG